MAISPTGVAVRPYASDTYWPPVGTRVPWVLAEPIRDIATAVDAYKKFGWTVKGTIGNTAHLRKHGDHTPWSAGKRRGFLYAVDIGSSDSAEMRRFRDWLIRYCKSSANTLWIDFINILGKQYDNAGNYLQPNDDTHCHISANMGYEAVSTNLFQAYVAEVHSPPRPPVVPAIGENEVAIIIAPDKKTRYWTDGAFRRHIPNMQINNEVAKVTALDGIPVTQEYIDWLIPVIESIPE